MIHICSDTHTWVWGQHIPLNAWYGQDSQGWWFCTAHGKSEDNSLVLFRFNGTRWVKAHERSNTTHVICQWAEQHNLWWTKCHWFKEEDKQTRLVARHDAHIRDFERMMSHDRKHKKGSSGIRLDKENYYAGIMVIDYECTKRTMHDFRQYYN